MSYRNKVILIGGLAGAALGAAAAWAYAQAQANKLPSRAGTGAELRLQAGASEYVKIATAVLAVIRQLADLFKPV